MLNRRESLRSHTEAHASSACASVFFTISVQNGHW
jgi:hypothetical protein